MENNKDACGNKDHISPDNCRVLPDVLIRKMPEDAAGQAHAMPKE